MNRDSSLGLGPVNAGRRVMARRIGFASALAFAASGVLGAAPAWSQSDPVAAPPPTGSDVGTINTGSGAGVGPIAQTPAASAEAPVQSAGSAPQAVVVSRILVQGNERIERATVISYLPIHVGDVADPAKIDLALKTLFRTDLFSNVDITVQGSDLVVKVSENPIINQVVFEGNKALKEDKLRDEVTVRPRAIFTRAKVEQDVQRIVELYRRSGKISATVTPKIVALPQKRVDLIFEIDEGPKSGILRVNFTGNQAFSDNDLRGVIVTRESQWYRLFGSNDNYDPDRIEFDKEQLRKYYRNRGYYDFRVISSVAELAPDKNGFVLTFAIDEGPKYRFGKVSVQTQLKRLDPKLLQQLLPIHEGDVYEDAKIEKATDALTFAAGASGFAFVDVRPRYVSHPETKTVDLSFDLREGPRVYVERIDIVGNTRTLDYVIRRELNVSEGDAYNRVLVERSKTNIRGLGFFKDVDIQQVPGSAPDKVVLQVKISEQPTGTFSFSIGYSSVDAIVGDVGVTEQNFRGRGQQVALRLSAGSYRQQIDFSFTEPRFGGRNLAAGFDLFGYRFDLTDQAAFSTSSVGGIARLGFPLSDQVRFNPRYTLKYDTISVADYLCEPDPLTGATLIAQSTCDARGGALTSGVGYTLRWDRRNDYINPTRGFFIQLDQDFAGLGGSVQYVRTAANGAWYYGFNPKWIVSILGSAGYIGGWGGDSVRINDRFFKGGTTFRGFDIAGIGPRQVVLDASGNIAAGSQGTSLGGKLFAIGTAELAFPTPLPEQYGVKMALFTDVGTLGLLDHDDKTENGILDSTIRDDLKLRASAGVSIFWRSPMGPLRFDLSHVFLKTPYDDTQAFRFSTATRF